MRRPKPLTLLQEWALLRARAQLPDIAAPNGVYRSLRIHGLLRATATADQHEITELGAARLRGQPWGEGFRANHTHADRIREWTRREEDKQ